MTRIILASQSPRRKQLMELMGLEFTVVPSDFEEWLDDSLSPESVAVELGFGKADTVAASNQDSIVIGSDTIVAVDGHQLGKPADTAEAREMLTMLAGKTHQVISSLAIVWRSELIAFMGSDTVDVTFKPFDETRIQSYLDMKDSFDKAGGYGIQSGAAVLIEKISGHYDTALGLPTWLLAEELQKLGIPAQAAVVEPPVFTSI